MATQQKQAMNTEYAWSPRGGVPIAQIFRIVFIIRLFDQDL